MPKGIFDRNKKKNGNTTIAGPSDARVLGFGGITPQEIIINEWLHSCTLGKLVDQLAIANPMLKDQILNQRPHIIPSGLYGVNKL